MLTLLYVFRFSCAVFHRVLFVNVASIFWAAFLSSVLNEHAPDAPGAVPTGEGAAPALRGGDVPSAR